MSTVKAFLEKMFETKQIVTTVNKRELRICLPFLGKRSLKIISYLSKLAKSYFPECKLQIIFHSNNQLGNYFSFKDKILLNCCSFVLYKFMCNLIYYGKTKQHFKVHVYEHLGISLRTGNRFTYNPKQNNNTAVLNHLHECKCNLSIYNFKIIGSAKNDYLLCLLKESLIIHKDQPLLNSVKMIPLTLFD